MTNSPRRTQRLGANGSLMWWALGLFAVFFLNVVLQRFWSGFPDISAAQEATLLVAATACFISACLRLETRQSPGS